MQWTPNRRREEDFFQSLMAMWTKLRRGKVGVRMIGIAEWIDLYALQAAQRMIVGLLSENARTWRAAARESMRGEEIYRALSEEMAGPVGDRVRQLVAENALLIKTLPQDVARTVTAMVQRRAMEGDRPEMFEKLIPGVFRWQARRIAQTETSKANTALTQARAEEIGLPVFIWKTSQDERVRPSHRNMENVIIRWDDLPSPERLIGEKKPPAPYAPGNIYWCRCYAEPVLRLDNVTFPHRVYHDGRIQMMTLAAFRRLANFKIQLPLAA